jgi:hypothetical protein
LTRQINDGIVKIAPHVLDFPNGTHAEGRRYFDDKVMIKPELDFLYSIKDANSVLMERMYVL